MDPEQTLSELRYLFKNIPTETDLWGKHLDNLVERFEALDEWLTKGGFSPWPANKEPNRFADQRARMSDAQRNRLWQMCADYNVPFREDDYFRDSYGTVEGWVGRYDNNKDYPKTIYVLVELDGRSHT